MTNTIQLLPPDKSQAIANTGRTPTPVTSSAVQTALPQNSAVDASAPSYPISSGTIKLATVHSSTRTCSDVAPLVAGTVPHCGHFSGVARRWSSRKNGAAA